MANQPNCKWYRDTLLKFKETIELFISSYKTIDKKL